VRLKRDGASGLILRDPEEENEYVE